MPPTKRTPRPAPAASARVDRWKSGKTALITGASGGIGYDLASVFAENGYNIVLVARSADKLSALANQARRIFGVSALALPADLTHPGVPEEIQSKLRRAGIRVNVLVNNAGFGLLGRFGYSDIGEDLDMLRLNIVAPVHLTRVFLPDMLLAGSGKILNVASTAGFQPGPFMANYYATKAYLISFSLGLAEEVRERGVVVSVLCPGPTPTGFRARAGIHRRGATSFAELDSRVVARAGYEGLVAGHPLIIPGFFNRLGVVAARHLPVGMVTRLVAAIQRQRLEGS